uniref:Uncharacterized protein n=1 Tax=Glossina brevipalpis TaxID=37001 RepID=A0A1A9WJ92_9MUSC
MKLIDRKLDGNKTASQTYSNVAFKSPGSSNVTIAASHGSSVGRGGVGGGGGGPVPKCKNYTKLICELTRLKAQQKYLECNQINLVPENFQDKTTHDDDHHHHHHHNNIMDNNADNAAAGNSNCCSAGGGNDAVIVGLINEINVLKSHLNDAFLSYHQELQKAVKDFYCSVKEIKEDVFKPQRLSKFSMNSLRERTVNIFTLTAIISFTRGYVCFLLTFGENFKIILLNLIATGAFYGASYDLRPLARSFNRNLYYNCGYGNGSFSFATLFVLLDHNRFCAERFKDASSTRSEIDISQPLAGSCNRNICYGYGYGYGYGCGCGYGSFSFSFYETSDLNQLRYLIFGHRRERLLGKDLYCPPKKSKILY